jgi:hypothetical protein
MFPNLLCSRTCAGFYGSLDLEDIDAAQYAAWEVDYLSMFELEPPSS